MDTSTVTDFINGIANWQFLQEPLYRWFIFLLAVSFMMYGWNGVLELMK